MQLAPLPDRLGAAGAGLVCFRPADADDNAIGTAGDIVDVERHEKSSDRLFRSRRTAPQPAASSQISRVEWRSRSTGPNAATRTIKGSLETWLVLAKLITGTQKGTGDNQAR
jgi:hypothetical protein